MTYKAEKKYSAWKRWRHMMQYQIKGQCNIASEDLMQFPFAWPDIMVPTQACICPVYLSEKWEPLTRKVPISMWPQNASNITHWLPFLLLSKLEETHVYRMHLLVHRIYYNMTRILAHDERSWLIKPHKDWPSDESEKMATLLKTNFLTGRMHWEMILPWV